MTSRIGEFFLMPVINARLLLVETLTDCLSTSRWPTYCCSISSELRPGRRRIDALPFAPLRISNILEAVSFEISAIFCSFGLPLDADLLAFARAVFLMRIRARSPSSFELGVDFGFAFAGLLLWPHLRFEILKSGQIVRSRVMMSLYAGYNLVDQIGLLGKGGARQSKHQRDSRYCG